MGFVTHDVVQIYYEGEGSGELNQEVMSEGI